MDALGALSNNPSEAASSLPSTNVGDEFNSFLQLLTAQIQNQDPLAPLDSTQFVEQLATFSSLEQQVQSNASLEGIAASINSLHAMLAGDWIGDRIAVPAEEITYVGDVLEFNVPQPAGAGSLEIADLDGRVIWTGSLSAGQTSYRWDGRTLSGEPLPLGVSLRPTVSYESEGGVAETIVPDVIAKVTDVSHEGGELKLGTTLNQQFTLGQIRRISE